MKNPVKHYNEANGQRMLLFLAGDAPSLTAAVFPDASEAAAAMPPEATELAVMALPVTQELFDEAARVAAQYELAIHNTSDADDTGDAGMGYEWHEEWDEERSPEPTEALLALTDERVRAKAGAIAGVAAGAAVAVAPTSAAPTSIPQPVDSSQAQVVGFVFGVNSTLKWAQLPFPLSDSRRWSGSIVDEGSTTRYWKTSDITMRKR